MHHWKTTVSFFCLLKKKSYITIIIIKFKSCNTFLLGVGSKTVHNISGMFCFNLIAGFSIKAVLFEDCILDVKELGGKQI